MSKMVRGVLAATFFGAFAALGFAPPAAADATCSVEATCSRYFACWGGWRVEVTSQGSYCTLPPKDYAPTCEAKNLRHDWTFDAGLKQCCRGSGDDRTCSFENVHCKSGDRYDGARGVCQEPERYGRPRLQVAGSPPDYTTLPYMPCPTAAACKETPRCAEGFRLSYSPTSKNYVCKKDGTTRSEPPTCAAKDMKSDWRFDEDAKQCCRGAGKERTCSAAIVRCPEGGTFVPARATCSVPTTIYGAPTL
jgi:hypothetical protein